MAYRVIHCGTGNVGAYALRAIINNPELELVGHYVNSPEKAGQDSGEIVGVDATGVIATNDWSSLYDLDADCLIYFGNSMGREKEAVMDLPPFLERGINVATFSTLSLAHPATAPQDERELIESACQRGNSTCFFTGIDPGWATTDLAIASLAVADQIDCVRVAELGYFGGYTAEFAMRDYFGFGQEPGYQPLLITGGFAEKMWSPTLYQLAEVLGVELEAFNLVYDTACLDHDIETGFGTVKAGTASVVRFELQALNKGKPFAVVEHVDAVTREEVGKEWKRPYGPVDLAYRIEVEGDPQFSVELCLETNGSTLCAMPVINAVPTVCEARPGLLGPLDLPRYWSRKRVRR